MVLALLFSLKLFNVQDLDVVEGKFSTYFPLPYRVAIIIDIGNPSTHPKYAKHTTVEC
jgi:hypothetical protein